MNIQKPKILLLTAILLTTVFFFVPLYSQARGLVPCGGYKDDGTREAPCNVCDAFSIIAIATNWLIAAAGVYAVFQIVFGGFKLIIAMGNEEKITKGKDHVTNAVVGLVLVMMAFIIVNTVVNFVLLDGNKETLLVDLKNPFVYLNSSGVCHK